MIYTYEFIIHVIETEIEELKCQTSDNQAIHGAKLILDRFKDIERILQEQEAALQVRLEKGRSGE